MSARFTTLLLTAAAFLFLFAGKDRPGFHGVHEGSTEATKLPYEFMYSGAARLSESTAGAALLEGCLEAYGGRDHLAGLESFRLVFDLESDMFESGRVERTVAKGRRYRIQRANDARAMNGRSVWIRNGDKVLEQGEQRYRSELFSYLTMSLPRSLVVEGFDEPRYATRKGDPLGYLFFDKPDTLMLVVGIDPQTHLIRSSEGVVRQGEANIVYINRFDGHESFDGYIFPTELINISMGMEVGRSKLISVDVNGAIEDVEFDLSADRDLKEGR